jgi:hypothetical protein
MSKLVSDLFAATNESAPARLTDLKSSGDLPPDFEIDGCSLTESSNGPYEPGDRVQLEMTWTNQKLGHSGNLANYSGNYTEQGSSGGEVTPAGTSLYPTIEYDVDSGAADGDYDIFATYDENFNGGGTNVGVQQTVTVTVESFSISLSATDGLNAGEIQLDLTINSGTADYDVDIDRGTSSGGPYGTDVVTTTETSTGSYQYTDSGLTTGTTYYYQATVTEDSGNGDQDTATDSEDAP